MTTITSRWPPTPVPYSRGQNEKPGYSELIAVDAACLATLHGHTMGGAHIGSDATPNPAPLNPSNEPGHDHSGGIFGRPLFRSVATFSWDDGRSYSSNIDQGVHLGSTVIPTDADGVRTDGFAREFMVWVPPCETGSDSSGVPIGAYRKLGVCVTGELDATALVASDVLGLVFERISPAPVATRRKEFVLSTSPTSAGTTFQATSSSLATRTWVDPGAFNYFRIYPYVDRQGTGSSRGCTFEIQEIELGVYST